MAKVLGGKIFWWQKSGIPHILNTLCYREGIAIFFFSVSHKTFMHNWISRLTRLEIWISYDISINSAIFNRFYVQKVSNIFFSPHKIKLTRWYPVFGKNVCFMYQMNQKMRLKARKDKMMKSESNAYNIYRAQVQMPICFDVT